ncbi:MAG: hypothetical protein BWY04_00180 [candidate division CPR1 bacterium ADurb.Bin160]|uniref:Uncharacterized protein n=1 Tax=candidate division CPR1 bacterium ADurb.Bin160 TaxID=1852826 RepID=A0A1V5ZQ68_9BACT|nr:MAG: hypothetical protein BWY04_00180 [candidate division CPR1 bacterium ADurb.Bin160]
MLGRLGHQTSVKYIFAKTSVFLFLLVLNLVLILVCFISIQPFHICLIASSSIPKICFIASNVNSSSLLE